MILYAIIASVAIMLLSFLSMLHFQDLVCFSNMASSLCFRAKAW